MKTAVLLAAGAGTRLWPYAEIRPKALVPVANKPLIAHNVEALREIGFSNIVIAAGPHSQQIVNTFRGLDCVQVVDVGRTGGAAFSLAAAAELIPEERFLVLYGDTWVAEADLKRLVDCHCAGENPVTALIADLAGEAPGNWVCCTETNGTIDRIAGHPRDGYNRRFCAYAFDKTFLTYVKSNSGIFSEVQIGMMPPEEGYLAMSLVDYLGDGGNIPAVGAEGPFYDIDKPWHILTANRELTERACAALQENEMAEGAVIDATAFLSGFVRLGRHSRIGRNVVVEGNVIVGDNTLIENGAILRGDNIIGSHAYVGNYCQIGRGSTVGNRCVVNHCAELNGMIMDHVYLYHYMEFNGIIGTNTDLGAATVCGGLRFDDGPTTHEVKGRREVPKAYANAVFLGDYCRTGVNATLMPGCKVGVYSVVGPGVLLNEDVPNRTMIHAEQNLVKKAWGPGKYGW